MSKRISFSTIDIANWVDLLQWRAEQQPDKRVYSFLADGEVEKEHFTHAELDLYARSVGSLLQAQATSGERALLIYPSGLEFIAAFFGCLYSGIIAVPVYPPSATRSDRTLAKFRVIAQNVQPAVILTTTALTARVRGLLAQSPEIQQVPVIATDTLSTDIAQKWSKPQITGETLAFLQYTSGSTGTPKGVMVTHRNLLENSRLVEQFCQHPEDAHGVTWLPLYHDLGLIGGVLQPLYAGYESTIMPPAAFLQRPIRWLRAVSTYKATISGGPNFAFDLCARKITDKQKAELDLSYWDIVANGAEPVRAETLERFSDAFASTGFRRNHFYPCYGMAEYTLVISAGHKGTYPLVRTFASEALAQNEARTATEEEKRQTLVSIGNCLPGQRVLIVDPEKRIEVPTGHVGEIWAAGPSVAQGYWQRPEETEETFHAHLANGEGPFLRTGDLGFMYDGELFITGRLKDLIIIRGSNHYPQDIELTVEKSHPAVRSSGSAAFSLDVEGEERLVVVAEIERQYLKKDPQEIFATMRQTIAEAHDLQIYTIVLLKTGTLPKTSSGKVQRRTTRESLLKGDLDIVARWTLEEVTDNEEAKEVAPEALEAGEDSTVTKSAAEIQDWLVQQVAASLKVRPGSINVREPFAQYGMDSLQGVSLSADLEDWLGRELPPTLVYDYPNIESLARYLAGEKRPEASVEVADTRERTQQEAIAVVGLGCRFPGADGADAFWQLLRDGVDGISEVPASRWNLDEYYAPERGTPGKMNTRWGGFIKDVDKFDPYFFGISPREAAGMDPQQRILLEVAWEALENASIPAEHLAGKQAGVFVGVSSNDYAHLQFSDTSLLDAYAGTGNAHSIVANRLSYLLDLRGPSMAIDTACSSSLVAVHLACLSIRNGECEIALAAGVNLMLTPELTITFSQAHMMSEYGRCRTFDNAADGYVRGEGCGVVVLKPLSAALRDGDNILALIRGSAVNQDGRSNGLTAPNGPSQEAVIRQALRNAGVTPDQINYVETHGSSTPLGDPIEVDSLKAVLMEQRSADQPCALGSVKTNIGHLEAAAGIAGLIKAVLSLHHGEIPPHLHFQQLNEHISFKDTTFVIPTERTAWPANQRRLAGVSAFGFGGTNVHVVLEGAPEVQAKETSTNERVAHVVTLSARDERALKALAGRYERFLEATPAASLADMSYTASTGRSHFAQRLALVSSSPEQLREQLAAFSAGQTIADGFSGRVPVGSRPRIAFLFTGQGSQYVGMARQLYETQPVFREALERCDQILSRYLAQSLLSVLYPEKNAFSPLDETAFTQPALFALEYAMAELWRSWGVVPDVVMGHSVGEYVAACVAGALSLEDGLKLIASRGRLMQELPERGEMVVVFAAPEQVEGYLSSYQDQVSLAAINGPSNTVISGREEAIQAIVARIKQDGLSTHPMTVSHAFHSPLMEPMLDTFEAVASEVQALPLRIPLVSNLTGALIPAGERLDASYWRQHVRSAVRFNDGMQALAAQGYTLFLELGPHAVLGNMGKRCLPNTAAIWLASLRKGQDDWRVLAQSVAALYTQGVSIDWNVFADKGTHKRLALPTYPFERERFWLDLPARRAPQQPAVSVAQEEGHPLLRSHTELVYPTGTHVWESVLDKRTLPYLNGHRIQGAMAAPVSVYIEMALAAAIEVFGVGPHTLAEIELKKLLVVPEQGEQKVQVILAVDTSEQVTFHVYSHAAGLPDQPRQAWALHASGKIYREVDRPVVEAVSR